MEFRMNPVHFLDVKQEAPDDFEVEEMNLEAGSSSTSTYHVVTVDAPGEINSGSAYDPAVVAELPNPLPNVRRCLSPNLLGFDADLKPIYKPRSTGRKNVRGAAAQTSRKRGGRKGRDAGSSTTVRRSSRSPPQHRGNRCCVPGCTVHPRRDKKRAYHFPPIATFPSQRQSWIEAIKKPRLPLGGAPFHPLHYHRVCEDHFFLGQPSRAPSHPDYAPSIFTWNDVRRPTDDAGWRKFNRQVEANLKNVRDGASHGGGVLLKTESASKKDPCTNLQCEQSRKQLELSLNTARKDIATLRETLKIAEKKMSESQAEARSLRSQLKYFREEHERLALESKGKKPRGRKARKSTTTTTTAESASQTDEVKTLKPVDPSQVPDHIKQQAIRQRVEAGHGYRF